MKSTSGKHLTTVACNDYALKTFEEAWESKPSGSCPPAWIGQYQIGLFHFTIPKWMSCTCRHNLALPSLSRLLSTSTRPPTNTGRAAKCTEIFYACSCTHGRATRRETQGCFTGKSRQKYTLQYQTWHQDAEWWAKKGYTNLCDFHIAKRHHCTKS